MTDSQTKCLNKYIHYLKITGKTGSISHIKFSVKIFFKYLIEYDLELLNLNVINAQGFQSYLLNKTDEKGNIKYCKKTVLVSVWAVSSFYSFLKNEKAVFSNPFSRIKLVKQNKSLPRNILDEEKTDILLKKLRCFMQGETFREKRKMYKVHVIAELMYSTGMRINEIAKLKDDDIDFNRGTVKITDTKTKIVRQGILNEYCQKILRIYIDKVKNYLFYESLGACKDLLFGSKTIIKDQVNKILTKKSKQLGFGSYTSHNFRHALGFHLLRAGCDIRFIQNILGHKDLGTTQIYTKVEKKDLKNILDKYHPRKWKKEGKDNEKP